MPSVYVMSGANGAGKTTTATKLLPGVLGIREFVNADTIAQGISGFDPGSAALEAGRLMLKRIRECFASRADFAFETTLASRSFAPLLREARAKGYTVNILFLWLRNPRLAIKRVAQRAALGGHRIADDVIRRRYTRGLANLLTMYIPLADKWQIYDNSGAGPDLVAEGERQNSMNVYIPTTWNMIRRQARQ